MFIRSKTVKGTAYYQLVENRRIDGNVRKHVILALGTWPTLAAAKEGIPKRIEKLRACGANTDLLSQLLRRIEEVEGSANRRGASPTSAGTTAGGANESGLEPPSVSTTDAAECGANRIGAGSLPAGTSPASPLLAEPEAVDLARG